MDVAGVVEIDKSPIGVLADEYVARSCDMFPSVATSLGVGGHDHLLDNFSDNDAAEVALYSEFIGRLMVVEVAGRDEELARDVMLADLIAERRLVCEES